MMIDEKSKDSDNEKNKFGEKFKGRMILQKVAVSKAVS